MGNRSVYLETIIEAHKLTRKERQTKKDEFFTDLEPNRDSTNAWRTIKVISGFPNLTAFRDTMAEEPLLLIMEGLKLL